MKDEEQRVMSEETTGVIIGASVILLAGFLTYLSTQLARLWHTPKRLDRIEMLLPPLLRAILCILKNQKAGKRNGTTDKTIDELEGLLANQSVSQKTGQS